MKPFWRFDLASQDFALHGTGHAQQLCVCCYCVTADVGSMHLLLCLRCRLVPMLATIS